MSFYGGSKTSSVQFDNPFLNSKQAELDNVLRLHHQNTKEDLEKWKTCILCSCKFQNKSMGTWQCRYHPGDHVVFRGEVRYTCCYYQYEEGSLEQSRGCTRCDHTEVSWKQFVRPITKVPTFGISWIDQTVPQAVVTKIEMKFAHIEFRHPKDVVDYQEQLYGSVLEKNHVKVDRTDFFKKSSEY